MWQVKDIENYLDSSQNELWHPIKYLWVSYIFIKIDE